MKHLAILIFSFAVVAASAPAKETKPMPADILKRLKPDHPRLIIETSTPDRIRAIVARDPNAARWLKSVRAEAKKILGEKPSIYEIPDGRRLLSVSRKVKERVRTLAFVYLLDGGQQYVDRAWAELSAAAAFKDWNPKHFLDCGEMTHALAIGYDWLYDEWTDEQRATLRDAIVDKGLKPAKKVYDSGKGWHRNENNWNQVCNGGIGLGALAVADTHPEMAAEILKNAIATIPRPMEYYAPDGAGTEGVTYWDYGTRYNVLFLCGLETALGTDFGLSQIDGFRQSGDYQMYLSGADRLSFNFGDCGSKTCSTAQHMWFSTKFDQPRHGWFRYDRLSGTSDGDVLDLLWYDNSGRDFDPSTLALDKYFRKAEVASIRSAWGDRAAMVLAIQGGRNATNGHRHLDLGTFILEALGERWFIDFGSERQTYLRHTHKWGRYDFYRTRAEGHNVPVINPGPGLDQHIKGKAKFVKFDSQPDNATAVLDLTTAYADNAKRVTRTFETPDRKAVVISDVIEMKKPSELWWFAHTPAKVSIDKDGRGATLTSNGKKLRAEIVEPANAKLTVRKSEAFASSPHPDKEADNSAIRKLAIHLEGVKQTKIVVRLAPVWE